MYVSRRNWRKAYRALSASPLLPDTPDTRQALAALHPQAAPPDPHSLADRGSSTPPPRPSPRRAPPSTSPSIHKLPMDRAAGDLASGNEELRGVAAAGATDALFRVVSAFNDGSLDPAIYDALEPSSLFGLRKPNGKARPIAVGDSLEALAGRCILEAKRPLLREYFCSDADMDACLASDDWRAAFAAVPVDPAPPPCPDRPPPKPPPALQLAFSPAGTDMAHFALQALYEQGGAIFGHDGINTFNTISRVAAADAIRACPVTADLLPAYRLKYGRLRSLRYGRQPFTSCGELVHSCLGPQQGCTWGTLVCALVHQRALTLAALRHQGSTVIGFADDAHVHNLAPQHAFSSLLLLRQVLRDRAGVQHNDKGGCIAAPGVDLSFAPSTFPGSPHHAAGPHRAYSALGCFVGDPGVVSAALRDRVLALDRDLDSCRYLVDSPTCRYALQARLRLICDCACHSVTHLVRAHAPAVSSDAAVLHDKLVRHAVFHGLAPPPDSPSPAVRRAGHLLHLPARLGGHGFTSAATTAPTAFLASSLEALAALRPLLPHFGDLDLAADARPTFVAMRAAHATILSALSVASSAHDAIDASAPFVDAFGDTHPAFHPPGLPAFSPSPFFWGGFSTQGVAVFSR